MDLPREPDVLAQPTRARLFEALSELRRPAGTEELAARIGLHPNGVRAHLERLHAAGLLTREPARQAVGRPRDMWSIHPSARPGGEPPSAYVDLGRALVQVISQRGVGPRAVEATGREVGKGLAPQGAADSRERQMHGALAALGFQPERKGVSAGAVTYRLGNCPYRGVARESQQVVCTLHRGVTRGLLDAIAPETELAGFVALDPDEAGCLIELRGGLAADSAPSPAGTSR